MNPISNNQFLAAVLEDAAWKELSSRGDFSMEMLEKYEDKLDWDELSSNPNIMWTPEGISKFLGKINWEEFSRCCPAYLLTEDNLLRFKDNWRWENLSNREEIYNNWSLLDKVADYMVWKEIITNWGIKLPIQFFKRYESRIPMSYLQDSRLWNDLVEDMASQLKGNIAGFN